MSPPEGKATLGDDALRNTIFAATAMALALTTGAMAGEDDRRITVSGTGQIEAAPDMATLTIGVTNQSQKAAEAMQATSAGVTTMLDTLSGMGIESRDLQTQQISLNPVWSNVVNGDQRHREITGYVASNTVNVRLRDLDGMGQVMAAVLDGGANDFNGLQFSVQEPQPLMDAARGAAVEDAIRKARQLAEAAGVTLGDVVTISEGSGYQPGPEMAMMRMASDSMPVAAGELTVTANVTMVFAIAD